MTKQTQPAIKSRKFTPEQEFVAGYNALMKRTGIRFVGVPFFDAVRDASGNQSDSFCVRVQLVLAQANLPKDQITLAAPPAPAPGPVEE